ncbi:hypothetical protein CHS0354_010224 [Potamilus streckersoni]|uniref:Cathepsin L n=1 Tax=Potamilus streckersoni TaxID=2493646 RepID=A0AAE0VHV3_9BIVA|nr:hypothetical protein CHS0354_010224 [Potamilus streckersoni]
MMFRLIVLSLLASSVLSAPGPEFVSLFQTVKIRNETIRLSYKPYRDTWVQYKKDYGKSYRSTEIEDLRYTIFESKLKLIEEHNARYVMGKESFYLGFNQFSDMTELEFLEMLRFVAPNETEINSICSLYLPAENTVVPDYVDWTEQGYVTPVKNQTGSLEGQNFRKTGQLVALSEQQLVDCSSGFGNMGCDSGYVSEAFAYIQSFGGVESEQDYPYIETVQNCMAIKSKVAATCSGCIHTQSGSESSLQLAVAGVGPVSVAIYASSSFQNYQGGVYDNPLCNGQINHAVLIVGYGKDKGTGKDYWLVKNSWGTSWGENGYIKMSRNKSNQCWIADMVLSR